MSTDASQVPSLTDTLEPSQEAVEEEVDASSESDYKAGSEPEEADEARSEDRKSDEEDDADMTMKLKEIIREELGGPEAAPPQLNESAPKKEKGNGQEEELLLSDLSEDEALAASLA